MACGRSPTTMTCQRPKRSPLRARVAVGWLLLLWQLRVFAQTGGDSEEQQVAEPFPAVPLRLNEWTRGTCGASGWKDYSFTVDSSQHKANLHFEVQDITNELRLDAVDVHVVANERPLFRHQLGSGTVYGVNNIYSRSLTYPEVEATTYYILIRCRAEPVPFLVRASTTTALLTPGAVVVGEVCPSDWLYHKVNLTAEEWPLIAAEPGGIHHVTLRLAVDSSSVTVITADDSPPLFLSPPLKHLSTDQTAADETAELSFCNVSPGGLHYVGVVGSGRQCAKYTISASYKAGESCEEEPINSSSASGDLMMAEALELRRFSRGHLEPLQTADYRFTVPQGAHYNLLAVLQDDSLGFNPTAMSLRMFKGSIPADRATEFQTSRAANGLYSLGVDAWELSPGDYFFSVTAGQQAVDYRLVAQDIRAELRDDGAGVQGHVCPGSVMFHYYDTPSDTEGRNIRFHLRLHTGEVYHYTSIGHPPLKMLPPYQHVTAEEQAGEGSAVPVCGTEAGARTYIAIKATDVCTIYDISVEVMPSEEQCRSLPHMCTDDCQVLCEEVELEHRLRDSCVPGESKRYMTTLTEEQAASNLEIQVEDRSARLLPSALLLQHFEGSIPNDFKTQRFASLAPHRLLSVTISSWDLQPGRHFILVTCSPAAPAEFSLYTHLSPAQLMPSHVAAADLCPGNWFHYFVAVDSDGKASRFLSDIPTASGAGRGPVVAHVMFKTWLHVGALRLITRQDTAPLKLLPPFHTTTASEQRIAGAEAQQGLQPHEVWHCNATAGQVYLGLRAFQACASFELQVEVFPESEGSPAACTAAGLPSTSTSPTGTYDTFGLTSLVGVRALRFGHATLSSCAPGAYQDFYFDVDAADEREHNLLLGLEDLTNTGNPTALSLLLFKHGIPVDRVTEHAVLRAVGGEYSLPISAWDMQAGRYYVSVKCGAQSSDFRLLPRRSKVEVASGQRVSGTVCPGDLTLHRLDVAKLPASRGKHLTWTLTLHSGDTHVMLAEEQPQLRLAPPYVHFQAERTSFGTAGAFQVSACDVERLTHYITLVSGDACAEYDIMPTLTDSATCSPMIHQPREYAVSAGLTMEEFYYGSCDAFGVRDYLLHVGEADSGKNLEIVVQDLTSHGAVPDSLGVYLFEGAIPVDRNTQVFDELSTDGSFSVSVSAYDLKAPQNYFVSIKCRRSSVKFRILPTLTESQLQQGRRIHGEVCSGQWAHHFFDHESSNEGDDGIASAVPTLEQQQHLRYTLDVYSGDAHFMLRPNTPPITLAPPFRWADAAGSRPYAVLPQRGFTRYTADVCNLSTSAAELFYFSLRGGGRDCMIYNVGVEVWKGDDCEDLSHDSQLQLRAEAAQLQAHRTTQASCQAGSWTDFYFEIREEDENKNVALSVEDLTNAENPDALEVHLYREVAAVPEPRRPSMSTSSPRLGVYSLAMDEINVAAGRYFLSVRCRSAFVRFRVTFELAEAVLQARRSTGGYVVPGSWAYHYFEAQEGAPHFRFEITIFSGSIYLVSTRPEFPPSFTTMAAATYMQIVKQDAEGGESNDYSIVVCNGAGRRHYVGLYGGERLATYIIHAAPFDGECETGGEDEGYIEQGGDAASRAEKSAATSTTGQLSCWRTAWPPVLRMVVLVAVSLSAALS